MESFKYYFDHNLLPSHFDSYFERQVIDETLKPDEIIIQKLCNDLHVNNKEVVNHLTKKLLNEHKEESKYDFFYDNKHKMIGFMLNTKK